MALGEYFMPAFIVNQCAESYIHCEFLNPKPQRKKTRLRVMYFLSGALRVGGCASASRLKRNLVSGPQARYDEGLDLGSCL